MAVRSCFAFACILTATTTAHGQTIVDSSRDLLPSKDVESVLKLVAPYLRDPVSAQIRGLRMTDPGYFCGQVNAKTLSGGYSGFRPFVVRIIGEPLVIFQADRDDGQFERRAVILPMPAPGKGCIN